MIAGSARGTRLRVPPLAGLRPTGDRVRESLFQVLAPCLPGARVLDLFAGSGALGIEALSRGADAALFVDRERAAVAAVRDNLERARLAGRARVWRRDWRAALRALARAGERFDLVLLDPPYAGDLAVRAAAALARTELLAAGATLAIEHRRGSAFVAPAGWLARRSLQAGDTEVLLLRRCDEGDGGCVAATDAPC